MLGATKRGVVGDAIAHLTPQLIGEDPINVERLWHKLWVPKLVGRRGMTTRAIGAIDIALWDLRAKVAGMAQYDPFWFEEPIAPDDYEGHKRIAEKTAIPIATGENEYTRYGFRDLIATGSVPILNADAMVLGGVSEFMKVAALAQAHDLEEFYPRYLNPMWGKVYAHTLTLNDDGTVSPPEVPGIGLEPRYDTLAPYREE